MDDFDEKNAWVCEKYPEILFLDYSRYAPFSEDLQWFKDADHLNSKGGDEFTKLLLGDLVEHGILEEEVVNIE